MQCLAISTAESVTAAACPIGARYLCAIIIYSYPVSVQNVAGGVFVMLIEE